MRQGFSKLVVRPPLFIGKVQAVQPGDTNDADHGIKPDPHGGDAHHQQVHQHDDRQQEVPAVSHHFPELGKITGRQAFHALLHRADMNEQIHRGEIQQGRKHTDFYNVEVRHTGVFRNQEGAGAHQRRHDLATGTGCGFNATRLGRTKAQFLHQRNGKRARGYHVGDGTAGDGPHAGRGQNRSLGGAAALTARRRKRQIDEEAACAGHFQHGAEQHKDEHERSSNAQRQAENPFLPQIQLGTDTVEGVAAMVENARQPLPQLRQRPTLATHRVEDGNHTDHRQPGAYRPAAGLQQGDGAYPGHDNIGLVPEPGPTSDLIKEPDQIETGCTRGYQKAGINQRRYGATRSARTGPEQQKAQHHHQRQVNAPLIEQSQRLDTGAV